MKNFIYSNPSLISPIISFLFGLILLFSVISAGDGTWFYYANCFLSGKRIYTEMHLVQQPVFILLNAFNLSIFGTTFVGQKIIFILVLFFYVLFSYFLVARLKLNQYMKAILYLAFFFTSIHFEAYRFDDYHAFANTIVMGQLLLVFKFLEDTEENLLTIVALGLSVGVLVLTRVNDGVIIMLSVMLIFILSNKPKWSRNCLIFMFSIFFMMLLILLIANENILSWFNSTIFSAVGSKGGLAIFMAPLYLIFNSVSYIFNAVNLKIFCELFLLCIAIWISFTKFDCKECLKQRVICYLVYPVLLLKLFIVNQIDSIVILTAISITILFFYCSYLILFLFYKKACIKYDDSLKKHLPLIIVTGLFVSGSLSTGGYHYSLYFQLSLFLICFFYAFTFERLFIHTVSILLITVVFVGVSFRVINPYSWHSYNVSSLVSKKREFIYEPRTLHYLFIDKELYDFIEPVCTILPSSNVSLLSIPFPFANYFCGIAPYKNYVQTFFDTTPRSTVKKLMIDLSKAPPNYIFYQQQLKNLKAHEVIFNKGNPLPQRDLDAFIVAKIKNHEWKVIYSSDFGVGNHWFLISTNPESYINSLTQSKLNYVHKVVYYVH